MANVAVSPFWEMARSISDGCVRSSVLILVAAVALSACGHKEKKVGQSLVRVDGTEITLLQLNEELKFAGITGEHQDAASKQLLESLIDRQLIVAEAMRNKIDRTPDVMQAIERAKQQIISQSYLQSVTSKIAKPTKAEINDYYQKHPEFFEHRKEFVLKQLVIGNKNFIEELRSFMDSAHSLDEVASWMDKHGVIYARGQTIRSTADLPQQVAAKLMELPKGKLFLVSEGNSKVLSVLVAIKDTPVSAINAAPQIEQFLVNKLRKEAAEVEIAHLRSMAKIDYLNASAPVAVQPSVIAPDKMESKK